MMKMNKVLIKLFVPMLGNTYDLFIPVNELVWKINKLVVKSVSDLSEGALPIDKEYMIINADNGRIYTNNEVIINTDIRNNTELYLIEV